MALLSRNSAYIPWKASSFNCSGAQPANRGGTTYSLILSTQPQTRPSPPLWPVSDYAQNPLHTIPRNIPVGGEVASWLATFFDNKNEEFISVMYSCCCL